MTVSKSTKGAQGDGFKKGRSGNGILDNYRRRQKATFRADLDHGRPRRDAGGGNAVAEVYPQSIVMLSSLPSSISKTHVQEAGLEGVEQPEADPLGGHLQERKDMAVHQHGVAEELGDAGRIRQWMFWDRIRSHLSPLSGIIDMGVPEIARALGSGTGTLLPGGVDGVDIGGHKDLVLGNRGECHTDKAPARWAGCLC